MKAKHFAEFYYLRNNSFHNACGDRSVIILDGRLNKASMLAISAQECKKRNYDGFRLARGTFTNPFYLTAAVQRVGA